MSDLVDSGVYTFNTWAKQEPAPNGVIFYNRWLGEFNPNMDAGEANARLDHVGKITLQGQEEFMRGWKKAQSARLKHI